MLGRGVDSTPAQGALHAGDFLGCDCQIIRTAGKKRLEAVFALRAVYSQTLKGFQKFLSLLYARVSA